MREFVDILAGLLTPLIGVIAVYIAYQQYKTNRLRERREGRKSKLDVYKKVKLFLHDVVYSGVVPKAAYEDLKDAIAEADFLFSDEITEWLSDLYLAASEWRNQEEAILEYTSKMELSRSEFLEQNSDNASWQRTQQDMEDYIDELRTAHDDLKNRFSKHLR